MNNINSKSPYNKSIAFILGISAFLFLFLLWLIYFQKPLNTGFNMGFLPTLNALLNSSSAVLIVIGVLAVRKKRVALHKKSMFAAFASSSAFLFSYMVYHFTHGHTPFSGEGVIRILYFTILISHIVLCAVVLPMILTSLYFVLTNRISSHRKIAKWTFPLWLYVSLTGILIYFFLRI